MGSTWIKRLATAVIALAIAGGFTFALWPRPVPVDAVEITSGDMQVTVDEEGKTRIREIYAVSAPIAGKTRRSPREVGDAVVANETIVAAIRPSDPPFLDFRARRELEAAVSAARAALDLAGTQVHKARTELKFSQSDLARARSLSRTNIISERALEKSALDVEVRRDALAAAEASLELRRRELESAKARLIGPEDPDVASNAEACCIEVRAPVSGRVLNIITKSEQVVQAGAPLIEIGNPQDLEIVVELLSSDAVRVSVGDQATVEGWGRDHHLSAAVKRIEPSGFTKVSALGIEEQRVRVVLDLVEPSSARPELGHDFRVFVRIAVWQSDDVLRVPLGALFRVGSDWAVFRVENGVARTLRVTVGHRNSEVAEITGGVEAGDLVILHPGDRVADGTRVIDRK